eukprot:1160722-Pelagomonas_calceolata.AAC.14
MGQCRPCFPGALAWDFRLKAGLLCAEARVVCPTEVHRLAPPEAILNHSCYACCWDFVADRRFVAAVWGKYMFTFFASVHVDAARSAKFREQQAAKETTVEDEVGQQVVQTVGTLQEVYLYTSRHIMRVYPGGLRVGSTNYDPSNAWTLDPCTACTSSESLVLVACVGWPSCAAGARATKTTAHF